MRSTVLLLASLVAGSALLQAQTPAASQAQSAQQTTGVLSPAATEKLLPANIFFKGQVASVQARNSGSIRFPDGSVLFAAMVDNSGYSSAVRERFQLYFLTETPVKVSGKSVAPGAYGAGFLEDGTFVLMDVGGHDLLTVHAESDINLKRPRPLQIVSGASQGQFRLYNGRNFVAIERR